MTDTKKPSRVEEKIDAVEGAVHEVFQGAKESIAAAESSVERAKEVLGEGYGKVKARSGETLERAKEYLAEARSSLEVAREKMGELYGRSRELAEEAYERAKVQFEKVSAEVKKGYAKVKGKLEEVDVKEMRDDFVEYVRRNPGKSLLMALAAGFIIGYLVRRREP